ncbi:MAG TPA: lysophospholipid acyltransferase family protein [Candidatus Polarisedimenticolia bacterium]|jgi:KDO2-lipid IV(A) lauroyltransferase
MTRARAWFEYIPIATLAFVMRALPRRAALATGRAAGRLAGRLDRAHRRVALENLAAAFGETMTASERGRLAGRIFSHFGMVAADCFLMSRRSPRDLDRLVEYEGVENIRKAFLKGKGVFVFSGHFGNWEMVALMQGWLGYPMAMVTRPLDNPLLEKLLWRGRTASGNQVIHKRNAVREILRALRHGWCVAIVIDQDTRGTESVFVDFMGRPAATTPALARLALRTGAPVVPVFGVPLPGGRYRITYLPEVPVGQIAADRPRDEAVVAVTQACTTIIEEQVRARPECWLWMHRRWKRRPRPGKAAAPEAIMAEKEGA